MTVPSTPCIRSHELSRYELSTNGSSAGSGHHHGSRFHHGVCVAQAADQGTSEIYKLVRQMPQLMLNGSGGGLLRLAAPRAGGSQDHFDLIASTLDPSWFVNVVVTLVDRNGTVIFHEA